MEKRETAEEIEKRATHWVARLDRVGDSDAQLKVELDAWLAADPRRQGAYFRAAAAWHMLDRASVLGRAGASANGDGAGNAGLGENLPTGLRDAPDSADSASAPGSTAYPSRGGGLEANGNIRADVDIWDARQRLPRRRLLQWGGGTLAASFVAGVTALTLLGDGALTPVSGGENIATKLGEIRRIPLADGSMASVNTQSRIVVDFKPDIRKVSLAKGEAWFRVAKNPERPFVVEAGDVRARAVGTAFSVRMTETGVTVQVTEGRVAVWRIGFERDIDYIDAGSRAFMGSLLPEKEISSDAPAIDRSLAWRQGELSFDGDTLGEAATEFNRYNKVQIRIDDSALAGEKLVGRFRTDEPDAFARAASTMLGADAVFSGGEIILDRR